MVDRIYVPCVINIFLLKLGLKYFYIVSRSAANVISFVFSVFQEFHQQQVVGTDGLQPVIKVVNMEQQISTLWRPSKFMLLLNCLREDDQLVSIRGMFKITAIR